MELKVLTVPISFSRLCSWSGSCVGTHYFHKPIPSREWFFPEEDVQEPFSPSMFSQSSPLETWQASKVVRSRWVLHSSSFSSLETNSPSLTPHTHEPPTLPLLPHSCFCALDTYLICTFHIKSLRCQMQPHILTRQMQCQRTALPGMPAFLQSVTEQCLKWWRWAWCP